MYLPDSQFVALLIFMHPDIPLRRIDLFIPCRSKHSVALRRTLKLSAAFNLSGCHVNGLGIAKYVLRSLESWSAAQPCFRQIFRAMPFGSKIVIENINCKVHDTRVRFVPSPGFDKQLLSVERRQQM